MATLVDHLRALPDDGLAALLRLRPDLVVPVPADLATLAGRAESRVSVARALDPLDRFTLEVLDALRLTRVDGHTSAEAVLALGSPRSPLDPGQVRAAVDRLRALFVVYGPEHALHIAAGVDEVCPPYPAGLGRPAAELDAEAAALCADPARLRRTVLAAPPAARAVLDRLAAGPPLGAVAGGATDDPESPVGWLVARHLLVPVAAGDAGGAGIGQRSPASGGPAGPGDAVELPREVGLLLRRDVGPLGALHPAPPEPRGPVHGTAAVDSAGAGQAMLAVRHTEDLLEALAAEPTPALKAGGLGVRELRRLARAAGVDETTAAALIETAAAAGLLAESEPELSGRSTPTRAGTTAPARPGAGAAGRSGFTIGRSGAPAGTESRFLPTAGYDHWRGQPIAARWGHLVRAWLTMPRQPGLAGRRDERDRPLAVLAPELERIGAPALRSAALGVLADAEPGTGGEPDAVLEVLGWRSPRRFGGPSQLRPGAPAAPVSADAVASVLAEAALLGVTGMAALTGYGRLLREELLAAAARDPDDDPLGVSGEPPPASAAVAALDALLPPPVDHVLLQADLTAVLPGPAEPGLAAELSLVAEAESTNVYRVTADSLRAALDAGYSAADLHGLFARRSRTPVPQGLTYLIDDVARRHGGLRVGSAGGYLRSDDEALLVELLADRRLSMLQLRRLAPTVLASPYPSGRLLSALREAGYAPVPEDASGAAVLVRPKAPRAPGRRTALALRSIVDGHSRVPVPRIAGIVEQLRRADSAARTARRAPVSLRAAGHGTGAQAYTQAMAVLQQALRERQRVWVGYVSPHGGTATRLVRPVSIGAGYLRAEDERTDTLHTFLLSRITGAVVED